MSKQERTPIKSAIDHQRETREKKHQQEIGKSVGYIELMRQNPNFRWLWGGQVVSLLGDWFNLIASAILIAELTGSGLALGVLFTIRMLAPFAISPLAGICADRYNRKHLLIITDLVRAVVVLGFLFVRDANDIWLLYALTVLLFGVSGFFSPARSAILPDITSPQELGTANTLGAATWSVMLAVGAAIGGLTTGLFGSQTAFVIDGFTFAISAGLLLKIRLPRSSPETAATPGRTKLTALRYMFQHPDILFIAMHKAAISLLMSTGVQVILVEIAKNYFVIGVGGALSLGMMYCMNGVGSGVGPILARRWTGDRDKPLRVSISFGYVIAAIGIVIIAPLLDFGTVLFGGFVRSIGGGIAWVFSTQLLLQRAPNEIRGRIFGAEFAFFTLMGGASSLIIGALLDRFQVEAILRGMAVLNLIPALLWSLWQRHHSRVGEK
ncbi:MFS transporter [Candidatus Poribacteria bacterium]|nr:MFS transporter [Candidatus Poribacteria bacterium]MYA98209.1 MFS transporter [Candidatus Poribacteria bacterium]